MRPRKKRHNIYHRPEYPHRPMHEAPCPDVEIFQGEDLAITNGRIYDDYHAPVDITDDDWVIYAEITSMNGYRREFSSKAEGAGRILKHEDGTFSFFLAGTETRRMLGIYYLAMKIVFGGHPMVSPQIKAFEVCQSGIGRNN